MATAIDSNLVNQLGLNNSETARKPSGKLGQDEFLKLMTTQLQNQDPMQPMDNGAFLGQIAQFAQVTGIQDMQTSVKQLVDTLSSNQAMQASSLVGKTVVAPAKSAQYAGERPVQGGVELSNSADNVVVGILDAGGQLIRKIELGSQESGTVPFAWDGLKNDGSAAPAGIYSLRAESIIGGKATAVNTLVAEPVAAVTLATTGKPMAITLAGGSTVGMSDIKQIM